MDFKEYIHKTTGLTLADIQIWYSSETWTHFKIRTGFEDATSLIPILLQADESNIESGTHVNMQKAWFIGGKYSNSSTKKIIHILDGAHLNDLPYRLTDAYFSLEGTTSRNITTSTTGAVCNLEASYITCGNTLAQIEINGSYTFFLNKFSAIQKISNEMFKIEGTATFYMVDESQIHANLLTGGGTWSVYRDASSTYNIQTHIATPTLQNIDIALRIDATDTHSIGSTTVQGQLDAVSHRLLNRYTVGTQGTFATIQAAITWLDTGSNMLGASELLLDSGTYTIADTIVIDLPYHLNIRGFDSESVIFAAATGLTNKPMFQVKSSTFFERFSATGSTLVSYGTQSTENFIEILTDSLYCEIKDFVMDTFYDGISVTKNSEIYVFNGIAETIINDAIVMNSTGANYCDIEIMTFTDCANAIALRKSSAGQFKILTCVFENGSGQTSILYVPADYIYTDGPTILGNTWNNTGTFISGFDFSLVSGRDANIYVRSNAGYEDKKPHAKVNVVNNGTGVVATTQGLYYKLPFTNGNSYNCKILLANTLAVTSLTGNGTTSTLTSTGAHGLKTGDFITTAGWTGGAGSFNVTLGQITVTGTNTFTFLATGNGTATGGTATKNNNRMTYQSANGTDMMFWVSGSIIDSQQNENIDVAIRKEIAVSTIVGTNTTTQTVTTLANHNLRTGDFVSLTNWTGGTGTWNTVSQIIVTGNTTFTYTTGGNCNGSPTAGTGNLGAILAPTTVRMGTQNVPVNFSFNVYASDVKQNNYFGIHVNNTSSAGRTITLSDLSCLAYSL